jgi:RNA polymerase sigma-70 factor (ECF subfamily)
MSSDEALMLEFQRGSREAFEELYARYCGPLHGFFRRRLENPQRAEDLAQETFLVVIRGAERYEPRSLVKTYLYAIALRVLAGERRKQRRDAANDPLVEPAVSGGQESGLWVREALGKLDSHEHEVLMLREYEQLSYAEIGELLRVPVNTVRSRLFRARMAMKQELEARRTSGSPSPSPATEGEA